jgi:hypothetical protein
MQTVLIWLDLSNKIRNGYTPVSVRKNMIQYSCASCGMGVVGMKCAKCNSDLVHDTITTADGRVVAVARCPEGCGKIKSPMCCGTDMTCPI